MTDRTDNSSLSMLQPAKKPAPASQPLTPDQMAHFFNKENQIFINKLNDICDNYDEAFKDVNLLCPVISLGQANKQDCHRWGWALA